MSAQGESGNKLELGGKNVKEDGVSVMSGLLEEDARTWSHPHRDTLTPKPELLSVCECQGLHEAGSGAPSPPAPGERGPLAPSAIGICLSRLSLTFPLAPSWMKAQTGW